MDLMEESTRLSSTFKKAFSEDGAGLIVIDDIPNFASLRKYLLPYSHSLSKLPEED